MAAERGGYEHANPFINIAFSHRQCSRQYWEVTQSRSCACAYTWCLPRFSLSRQKVFDFFFLQILSSDIKKFCNKMRLLLVLFMYHMSLCHCEIAWQFILLYPCLSLALIFLLLAVLLSAASQKCSCYWCTPMHSLWQEQTAWKEKLLK